MKIREKMSDKTVMAHNTQLFIKAIHSKKSTDLSDVEGWGCGV